MNNQNDTNATPIQFPYLLHPSMVPAGFITPRMLCASPKVAKGDLYYSQDGVNFTRLPIVPNAALVVQNGVPTWLAGFTGTVTIPKITTATGSITFVNGIATAVVQPT